MPTKDEMKNAESRQIKVLLDDGMQIPLGTGIGKYSEHLVQALEELPGVSVDCLAFEQEGSRKRSRLKYLEYINSSEFVRKADGYDLCIFTNFAMPYRKMSAKTAVTIHDLAVYDCPDSLPKAYLPYGKAMIRNSVRKADALVTVSQTMCKDIKKRFPRAAKKAHFAWPGIYDHVKRGAVDAPYDDVVLGEAAQHPFFLMVGTVEKRKNVTYVIEAFAAFKNANATADQFRLIVAGRPGFGFDEIESVAERSGVRDSILFTGYVSDNDCANLYRDARALVFPSVYEGFGSIQTECMQMGLPILLSDIPTNREVSRDYGVFFSLGDVASLASAMERMVGEDAAAGDPSVLLEDFSWAHVARTYLRAAGLSVPEREVSI